MAGIAGGELVGEPRSCRGQSARHGRTVRQLLTKTNRASALVLAFHDLKGGQSAHPTRMVRDLVRVHVFTQHGPHLTGGRSATWSAVQTGQSAPLTRTVHPCMFSTHSRTHEQPTHAPYVQPLYHILALFIHVSSCQLPIIAYIHDILIIKHHVHSCRDRDVRARRG